MTQFYTTETGSHQGLSFITVKSQALKRRGDICVYIPKQAMGLSSVKIVVLLHGVYGSHWVWSLKGGVHTTLDQMLLEQEVEPMILVMPSDGLYADGSAYVEHLDADYEKWIVEDLILACLENIKECSEDSEFHICGLSMGGYGALRLGAKYNKIFKSFSAHSSITEFDQMKKFVEDYDKLEMSAVNMEGVFETILSQKDFQLKFRFDCGKDDLLIEENRCLHKELLESNIDHVYEEFEGGHEWSYWQKHIRKSLKFFNQV